MSVPADSHRDTRVLQTAICHTQQDKCGDGNPGWGKKRPIEPCVYGLGPRWGERVISGAIDIVGTLPLHRRRIHEACFAASRCLFDR